MRGRGEKRPIENDASHYSNGGGRDSTSPGKEKKLIQRKERKKRTLTQKRSNHALFSKTEEDPLPGHLKKKQVLPTATARAHLISTR